VVAVGKDNLIGVNVEKGQGEKLHLLSIVDLFRRKSAGSPDVWSCTYLRPTALTFPMKRYDVSWNRGRDAVESPINSDLSMHLQSTRSKHFGSM